MAESRIDDVHEMEPLNPEALASRTSFDGEAELEKPDLASSNNNYMVGILMLLIVILCWTTSSFLVQNMMEAGWDQPFLVTLFNYVTKTVCLLPYFGETLRDPFLQSLEVILPNAAYERVLGAVDRRPQSKPKNSHIVATREIVVLVLLTLPIAFIAGYVMTASLRWTSVVSVTIISSTGAFFTLVLGYFFGIEAITAGRVLSIAIGFLGVVFTSISDSGEAITPSAPTTGALIGTHATHPLLGDILCLFAAFLYSLVLIVQRFRIKSEYTFDMLLFFGLSGLAALAIGLPFVIIVRITGIESFPLPPTSSIVFGVVINSVISTLGDFLYVKSMLKTTPVVVSVGASLTIPLAVLGDLFLGRSTKILVVFGAILVIASFVAIGVQDSDISDAQTRLAEDDVEYSSL